ncbi:pyridoxal phosphate-dependent transferase [Dactylonectria macrodidyma]|uniref:Pyridoxal phosphate-dependent transferase n=1 Tax=Dactylonectria macrodidyma TaxID=307937 RepID=A0A9P9FP77_9HYPO|nr:pyridoxal phosphate-dependent transferase [Dactylonectria macrodidyma]
MSPSINTSGPGSLGQAFDHQLSLSSRAIHGDDYINHHRAVAPALHVSTTFRYTSNPEELGNDGNVDPNAPFDSHVYSRYTAPNTTRLEALLTSYLGGPSLTYSSGLAAFHAILVFLNPSRIAIGQGYHGCRGVAELVKKLKPLEILSHSDADLAKLQPGDILHLETPFNPTGEAIDIAHFRRTATERGAWLTCDATLAPPPLQAPFALGVDIILHSGTKYIGGHSDLLCGVLSVRPDLNESKNWMAGLQSERAMLGSIMGSMEGWLGVRSVRTLELRVERQARNAERLVEWLASSLAEGGVVADVVLGVKHASLQPQARDNDSWLQKQMPNGFGGVFAMLMKTEDLAKQLPSKLRLFHHATSLGGVESLVEWRAISDSSVDRRLLRISIGVESWEDLRADLLQAVTALQNEAL